MTPSSSSSTMIPCHKDTREELRKMMEKSHTYDGVLKILIKNYKEKVGEYFGEEKKCQGEKEEEKLKSR